MLNSLKCFRGKELGHQVGAIVLCDFLESVSIHLRYRESKASNPTLISKLIISLGQLA